MNTISKQILHSHQFFPKLLVAAALIFSIIGIPWVIGYLARYLQQIKDRKDFTLPQWNNWLALLVESWELLVLILLVAVLPITLSVFFAAAIDGWFGSILWIPIWPVAWIPTMMLALGCPLLVALAYHQYLRKSHWDAVLNFKEIWLDFKHSSEELIIVTLMFWGAMLIGFPLIAFTISFGLFIYFPMIIQIVENNHYR